MRQKGEAEQKASRPFDLTVMSKACLTDIESKSRLRFTFFVFYAKCKRSYEGTSLDANRESTISNQGIDCSVFV